LELFTLTEQKQQLLYRKNNIMIKQKSALLISVFTVLIGTSLFASQVPMHALKIIAESRTKNCSICIKDMRKQAFAIIGRHYTPEKILLMGKSNIPLKTSECKKNEFLLSSYSSRELYKKTEKYGRIYFPIITYKFHTGKKHLVGINKNDYTNYSSKQKLTKFISRNKASYNKLAVRIIPYKYGDGKTFIFFPKRNVIQIQCQIVDN